MNELAIIVVGIILGLSVALLAGSIGVLAYLSWRQRELMTASIHSIQQALTRSNDVVSQLRIDVIHSLTAIDANRLSEASLAIQHSSKALNNTVSALNKVVFAAGMGDAGMGLPNAQYDEMRDLPQQGNFIEYDTRQANQAIHQQQAGISGAADVGWPPSNQRPLEPNDPFLLWQAAQREKADAMSGASFPAAPQKPLPDLDAAFDADIADPQFMSDHDILPSS